MQTFRNMDIYQFIYKTKLYDFIYAFYIVKLMDAKLMSSLSKKSLGCIMRERKHRKHSARSRILNQISELNSCLGDLFLVV